MDMSLSLIDFAALSPLLILLGGALILLLLESFATHLATKLSSTLTTGIILAAFIAELYAPISKNSLLTPWLNFDSLAKFFTLFFLIIGLATTWLAASFFQHIKRSQGEYYFLLLSALFGLILIGLSADFLTLFLGIETLSISLYVLCGYVKQWKLSSESSIKYFFMGSLAAAFLLYGIALIYGSLGTTNLHSMREWQSAAGDHQTILFLSGLGFVTLALAFEAAIVPLQMWAPDVYAGSPNPVTALMAVGTKVGAFAAFIRVFYTIQPNFNIYWQEGLAILAYLTLIYANFVALRQTYLLRFFAYSGIAHAGFLLIPIIVGTPLALEALLFYLIVYAVATMGSFAVLAILDEDNRGVTLQDLNGLFHHSPLLAIIFSLCLLTLAGIPPSIGFFAKFYVFKAAFQTGWYGLVVVGLLTTILSAFYYLRMIAVMLSEKPVEAKNVKWLLPAMLVGICCLAGIIGLSIYPKPLLSYLGFVLS